jgi:hypothetical protein
MFLNSYQVIPIDKITDAVAHFLIQAFMYVAFFMGFIGFVIGLFLLVKTILEYYSDF